MVSAYPASGPVRLHTLLDDKPRTRSLKSGAIESDLVHLDMADISRAHRGFKLMVREGAFDWGELAIVTFLQAKYYGKPLVLLPAVIGGNFLHQCIVCNHEVAELTPATLAGKRIGVRSYTQTTGAWVRGILQNEYGLDPHSVRWVCFEESHLAEYQDPTNVEYAPKDRKLADMLLEGEIDAAMIGPSDMPDDPRLQTVIPDPRAAAIKWYERKNVIPINHMAVVREELSQRRPDVVRELYRMLREGRDRDTKPVNGIQMMPYGVEALRGALETIVDYAFQQKIVGRRMSVDELFDDTTRQLD